MAKNINGKHIFKKNLYFLLQQSLNTSNVKVFGSQKNAKLRFEPQEKKSSFFPFACCLMVLPPIILPLTLVLHKMIFMSGVSTLVPQKKWEQCNYLSKQSNHLQYLHFISSSINNYTLQVYNEEYIFILL